MAKTTYEIKVTWAWWLKPYIYTLRLVSCVTGRKPDMRKATATSMKALRINGKPYSGEFTGP